jgi:hypothetical protein
MKPIHRLGVVALALVAVVAAFVLLQPGADTQASPASRSEAPIPAGITITTPATTNAIEAPARAARPKPKAPLLTAGRVRRITVDKGDTVRFRVRSSVAEEVHVHGYDLKLDVEPGKTATMSFPARLDGGFEIEFEHSGTQIAALTVNP